MKQGSNGLQDRTGRIEVKACRPPLETLSKAVRRPLNKCRLSLEFLQILDKVSAAQKIIVLDQWTVKILDSCLSMAEVLDSGVYLIENITMGRQPYPGMAAVYIITASDANIQLLGRDFTPPSGKVASGRTGGLYGEAHLFFTTAVTDRQMNQLAQSAAAPFIKNFQEIYLDFVPNESRVFTVPTEGSVFNNVFGGAGEDGSESSALRLTLDTLADKIASACVTMGDLPRIRYRSKEFGDERSMRLAVRLQQKLEELSLKLEFKPTRQSTLIIVDRTFDLLAPTLHEFTVQAMANDLVGLGADGTRYEYAFSTLAGPAKRTVSLDEKDSMWLMLRHAHIAQCVELIIENFNKFLSENKAAIKSRNSEDGVTSLEELKDTMSALGEFQEQKSEYALHLSLAQDCLSTSDKRHLSQAAELEQTMAMGFDPERKPLKDAWNQIASILQTDGLEPLDRARIVAIFLLTQTKIGDAEKRALFDHAALGPVLVEAVRKLLDLAGDHKYRQRPSGRPKGSKRPSILDREPDYDVSRYIPASAIIFEDAAANDLDQSEFPWLKPDGGAVPAGDNKAAPLSLRRPAGAISSSASANSSSSSPIYLFILGGVSHSEMRETYILSNSLKRDLYIGSDSLLTPSAFFEKLSNL